MSPLLILIAVLIALDIAIQAFRAFVESRNSTKIDRLVSSLETEDPTEMPIAIAKLDQLIKSLEAVAKSTDQRVNGVVAGFTNTDRWFNHLKGELDLVVPKLRREVIAQLTAEVESAMVLEREKMAKKAKRTTKKAR